MSESRWTRRDFLRRSAAATGVAVGAPALIGACSKTSTSGGNVLQAAKDQGSMKIAIADEAPYGFKNSEGQVTGYGPEVARVALQNLGIPEITAELTSFDGLISGLNAGHFNLVAAGMYITPKRCRQAAFSIPDYTAGTAFLVPKGNPKNVTRFKDIAKKDLKLAVLGSAAEGGYAKSKGVPASNLLTLDSQNSLLQAVVDGRTYAASLTGLSLKHLVKVNPDAEVEVTEPFHPVIDGQQLTGAGGFTFRKNEDKLRKAFNDELRKLHDSGKWLEVTKPFGFTEYNVPPKELTTEKLCSKDG